MPADYQLPDELQKRLVHLRRRVRLLHLLRGIGVTALILAVTLGALLFADSRWELPLAVRIGLLLGAAAIAVLTLTFCVFRPVLRRIEPAELAAVVERAHPELEERLTSLIELENDSVSATHKGSPLMRRRLLAEAIDAVDGISLDSTVPARRALRWSSIGVVATVLLLAPFATSPTSYSLLWARLVMPWGNFDSGGDVYFRIDGGDQVVARGSSVTIRAEVVARQNEQPVPSAIWFHWTDSSGVEQSRRMDRVADTATHSVTLPNVLDAFDFRVTSDRYRSRSYHIDVADPPKIESLTLQVDAPAYTGLPAKVYDGAIGTVRAVEQSRLKLNVQFSHPVKDASLLGLRSEPTGVADATAKEEAPFQFSLAADGMSARLEFVPEQGGPYRISAVDENGLTTADESQRILELVPDQPPQVQLTAESRESTIRPAQKLTIPTLAEDDFGISALELHYETASGKAGKIEAAPSAIDRNRAAFEFQFDTAPIELQTGDTLTYRARTVDNRPVPGPQEAWSEHVVLQVDSNASDRLPEVASSRQKDLQRRLQSLREEVAQQRQRADELRQPPENETKSAERAKQTEAMSAAVREAAQTAEQLSQAFKQHPLYDDLADPTQQVAEKQLTPAADAADQAAQSQPAERATESAKAAENLQAAEQELARLAERFQQLAALENDLLELGRLSREAGRLAEEANRMHTATSEAKTPEQQNPTTAEVESLERDQQKLARDLDRMLDQHPELMQAAVRQQRERLKEIEQNLRDLSAQEKSVAESLSREADQPAEQPDEAAATAGRDMLARQQELARDAALMALRTAEQHGDRQATVRKAGELAAKATEAARSALAGEFDDAAAQGKQGAARAQELEMEWRAESGNDPSAAEMREQSADIARRQAELADEFTKSEKSRSAQRGARQAGQEQIESAASATQEQLEDIARNLSEAPIELPEAGQRSQSAQQSVSTAKEAVQNSAKELGEANSTKAAQPTAEAAEAFQTAAEQAAAAAEMLGKADSPVPSAVGEQVAQASRNLSQAGEQLQRTKEQLAKGQTQPSSEAAERGEPGAEQSKKSDNRGLAESSQRFRDAAQALAQAAQRVQQAPGEQGGQPQAGEADMQSASSDGTPGNSADGDGSGSRVGVDLQKLQSEMQRRTSRDWGRLPGHLETEVLHSSQQSIRGEYARMIKLYFEALAKPPQPANSRDAASTP